MSKNMVGSGTGQNNAKDIHIHDNAFKECNNSGYLYQASDIHIIQNTIMLPHKSNFVIHEPIGNNQVGDEHLKLLIESLDPNKPTLCAYNIGDWHWTSFVALKTGDEVTILYKDSKGNANPTLEGKIKEVAPDVVKFLVNIQKEQTSGLECGIFALKNMEIMAQHLTTNKEQFIADFKEFQEFCSLQDAKSLRKKEFAETYVIGKYNEIIEGYDKEEKNKKLMQRHAPELEKIASELQKVEEFQGFTIIHPLTKEIPPPGPNTITLFISTQHTDPDDMNYKYEYRFYLSEDLIVTANTVIDNINKVLSIADKTSLKMQKGSTQNIVIDSTQVEFASFLKEKGEGIEVDKESPQVIVTKLLDRLDISKSLFPIRLIKPILKELFSNVENIDDLILKASSKKFAEDVYQIAGDDSSDEEREDEVYRKPLRSEHYNSADTKLKRVKLLKHHATKLDATEQADIDKAIEQITKIKGFLTSQKKISHGKTVKEEVEKTLAVPEKNVTKSVSAKKEPPKSATIPKATPEDVSAKKGAAKGASAKKEPLKSAATPKAASEDDAAKKAVLDAYQGCRSLAELKAIATKKFLSNKEEVPTQSDQTNKGTTQSLDFKWAFAFQDLGIRLLISNKVRKLYFLNKAKLGKFDKLPTKEEIEDAFSNAIKKTLDQYKELVDPVLQHNSYKSLVAALSEDKKAFFSLSEPTNKYSSLLNNLSKTIDQLLLQQGKPLASMQEIGDRRVETIIENLRKVDGFVTTKKEKVSLSMDVQTRVEAALQRYSDSSHVYMLRRLKKPIKNWARARIKKLLLLLN